MRNIRPEVSPERRNVKAAVHQQFGGIYLSCFFVAVITALFQSFESYSVQEHARLLENLYIFEECFALILCDKLPSVKAVVCKRIADAVIVAVSD